MLRMLLNRPGASGEQVTVAVSRAPAARLRAPRGETLRPLTPGSAQLRLADIGFVPWLRTLISVWDWPPGTVLPALLGPGGSSGVATGSSASARMLHARL